MSLYHHGLCARRAISRWGIGKPASRSSPALTLYSLVQTHPYKTAAVSITRKMSTSSTEWYKELASIPTFASAEFLPGQAISITSVTQDFTRNAKRKATRTVFPLPDGGAASGPTLDVPSDVQLTARSHSGNVKAIFRQTGTGDSKKRYIEVWSSDALIASIEATQAHEAFYADEFMGTVSFSPSEDSIVYLAEGKAPKATDEDPLAKFRYVPTLGEMLTDRKRPTIFVARWDQDCGEPSVYPLGFADDVRTKLPHMLTNARFLDNHTLVAIGHELAASGQLPSVRWCHNRPIQIYKLSLTATSSTDSEFEHETLLVSDATVISDPSKAARSPRVLKGSDGRSSSLFWLEHERDGPHASCSRLVKWGTDGQSARVLVDYVSSSADDFKGLFVGWALLERPFVQFDDKTYLISTSISGAHTAVVLVDTDSGNVYDITPADSELFSWTVLDTDGGKSIVCVRSSPSKPQEVVLGTLSRTGKDAPQVSWSSLWQPAVPAHVKDALSRLTASVVSVSYPVETILLESTADSESPRPLVSIIHGGPHGSSMTSFSAFSASLVLSGYTVSHPNYTGSSGYGSAHVSALIGKCGSLDVQDCVDTVNKLVDLGKAANPGYIYGGSHGGFIGGHLVGQHPDMFSGAVLCNPVITPLPAETDIPDWYFSEFVHELPSALAQAQLPPALYETLYAMTPIAHVQHVKTRVRLLLGLDDHRVSNDHGMAFYNALKAQGKDVDMLTFPGFAHAIDGVEETRVWVKASLEVFGQKLV